MNNTTMEKINGIEDLVNQTLTSANVTMENKFRRLNYRVKAAEERSMKPGPKGDEGVTGAPVCTCDYVNLMCNCNSNMIFFSPRVHQE